MEDRQQNIKVANLGKGVLQPIDCDNRFMLQAGRHKNECDADVVMKLQKDENTEILEVDIAALFDESKFQNSDSAEEDRIDDHLDLLK